MTFAGARSARLVRRGGADSDVAQSRGLDLASSTAMFRVSFRFLLAVCLATPLLACDRSPSASERITSGDSYLAQDKLAEALIEYQAAVQADGRDGRARLALGRAFRRAGDQGKALEQLVRAADLLPDDADVQLEAASLLLQAGRFEDAGARAESVLKKDARNAAAHVLRATAWAGLRDNDDAIKSLQEAIELDPNRVGSYLDLASIKARVGEHREAEAGFKQAIAIDPKAIAARLALANYYWLVGRSGDAEQVLIDALTVDDKHAAVNQSLANVYRVTRRAERAEPHLKRVAESTSHPQPQLELADYYISQRRPQDARAVLEKLASDEAAGAAARARLAGIEYEDGRRDAAHKLIDALLTEQPRNAQVLVVKGGWLHREGKSDEALAVAERAVAADDKSAAAYSLLGAVHRTMRHTDEAIKAFLEALRLQPRSVFVRVALAHLQIARGDSRAALDFAREAVKAAPQDGTAHFALARALYADGQVDEALVALQPVARALPDSAEVLALLGRLQQRKGDLAVARQTFVRALERDPSSADALGGLLSVDLAGKRGSDAVRMVEKVLASQPNNARALIIAGRTYAAVGDLAKSEAVLRKALEADPSALEAYHVLGQIFVRQKRLDDAREAYERRVAESPSDISAHTMVGMILLVQGKYPDARSRFEKILAIDPHAAVAANNLAYLDANAGQNLDVALSRAQMAKNVLPDEPDVNDTLGWVYVKRDLPALAIPHLEFAVSKDPANPLYQFHLGMAHLKAGNTAAASRNLQRALQLAPSFEHADEARKALSSIGT
jgi:putative PEP-CTERM system TPR-repeat lipoprotein